MISRIDHINDIDLGEILTESQSLGYRMIERLISEWNAGLNDFGKCNEAFFAFVEGGKTVGVGGINEEPYLHIPHYGRMRHLYVLKNRRRAGIGTEIVEATISFARYHFERITLRTPMDGSADAFYENLGFRKSNSLTTVTRTYYLNRARPSDMDLQNTPHQAHTL